MNDIPWLAEDPVQGEIPSGGVAARHGHVRLARACCRAFVRDRSSLRPTRLTAGRPVPVDFTILFNDVPQGSFAWNYIYGAAGAGVMPGCAPQTPTFTFCPAEVVTRRSMAGFIERAMHGALTPPPVYLGQFQDVLAGSFNANYIQGFVNDSITAGCSVAPPLYCPDVPVTRAQMAVFVWKGQHGDEAPPPAPTGVFADVPCPGGFAVDYIEGIAAEGVTAGCGNGNYCPNQSITNAQMAVFLVKAFEDPVPAMRARMNKQEGTVMNPPSMKKLAAWIRARGSRSAAPSRPGGTGARRSRQRHGHRRLRPRLAALRAHRDHLGLDRASRRLSRTP